MARINFVEHARKEYICSKCGCKINKGDSYKHATPFHRKPIIRCISCGLKPYETSTSEYVQSVGRLQDEWEKDYGIDPESIVDAVQEIYDMCENSLDCIPENLQEGPVAQTLQERMDSLEGVIEDLNCISTVEDKMEEDREVMLSDYKAENDMDDEYELNDDEEEDFELYLKENIEESLREEIEDALSNIE